MVADEYGDEYALDAKLTYEKKAYILKLKSIKSDWDEIDLGVDVTFKASDKMPSVSKYTDVLTLTEDDIEDLAEDIMEVIYDLAYLMY